MNNHLGSIIAHHWLGLKKGNSFNNNILTERRHNIHNTATKRHIILSKRRNMKRRNVQLGSTKRTRIYVENHFSPTYIFVVGCAVIIWAIMEKNKINVRPKKGRKEQFWTSFGKKRNRIGECDLIGLFVSTTFSIKDDRADHQGDVASGCIVDIPWGVLT
jgi:hypothetical protein